MRKSIGKQPAFLLRRYPYKSRSGLLDFLTRESGIVRLVAAAGPRRGRRALHKPQMGMECLLDWREGRKASGLANLSAAYPSPACDPGQGIDALARVLMPVSYMNELVVKFFQPRDPHSDLYDCYRLVAQSLLAMPVEPLLRFFEIELLRIAGFSARGPGEPLPGQAAGAGATPLDADGPAQGRAGLDGSSTAMRVWLDQCTRIPYRLGIDLRLRPGQEGLEELCSAFAGLPGGERRWLRDRLRASIDASLGPNALKTRKTMRRLRDFSLRAGEDPARKATGGDGRTAE